MDKNQCLQKAAQYADKVEKHHPNSERQITCALLSIAYSLLSQNCRDLQRQK